MPKKDLPELTAVVQRDGETYAITPRLPCGLITDLALLRRIVDVAERYGAQALKITSAQRLAIIGLREEDLAAAWLDLDMKPGYATGMCVRSVKACPGTTYCRLGLQDALGAGQEIEERYLGRPLPNKLKIAVSGCALCCAESWVRDIGLVGTKRGYTVVVGGSAGGKPRIAEVFATDVPAAEALALVGQLIDGYARLGRKKRIGEIVGELGLPAFREAVLSADPAAG